MSRRGHKYGAFATTNDGIRFASKAEAQRYAELRLLEKAGEILHLTLQPSYPLFAANASYPERGGRQIEVGRYVADFSYVEKRVRGSVLVIEDVKGVRTALYRWKKKHFEAQYGITITEIGRPARRRGVGRRKPVRPVPPSK